MIEVIKSLYAYNSWATTKLIDSLEQLSPDELNAPGCSGNGSIIQTFAHLMQSQWGWFSWLDGSLTSNLAMMVRVSADEIGTIPKMRDRWSPIDSQTTKAIETLSDEKLNDEWSWTHPVTGPNSLPLWRLLVHVATHGAHTRGQINAAIRRAGHAPNNIDFLNYSLETK